jgi:hypothetical protein
MRSSGQTEGMTNDKKHFSPGEASREGLRQLEEGHPHHGSTAHTPAPQPGGSKFDETASEVHRGGQVPNEKKK